MEFNEKLQELRRQKGLTQEQVAAALYVSRTAISKWEQGKGFPSIDSLKKIADLFSVTVDELLSSEKLLNIAEAENNQKRRHFTDLLFGFLDISVSALLFLPFFAQKSGDIIQSVSLLFLKTASIYIIISCFVFVALMVVLGILTLALQNCCNAFWIKIKNKISIILSVAFILLLILSLQPYAAIFLFLFLIMKVLVLINKYPPV